MSVYSISNSSILANVMSIAAGGIQFRTLCVFNRFATSKSTEMTRTKYATISELIKMSGGEHRNESHESLLQHCAHEKYAFSCGRLTDVSHSVPRYQYRVYCARRTDRRTHVMVCVVAVDVRTLASRYFMDWGSHNVLIALVSPGCQSYLRHSRKQHAIISYLHFGSGDK